jgi:hypothetical protein
MSVGAQVLFSFGFGILYWEMAGGLAGFEESAPVIGLMGVLAYLVAYLLPQALFRYTLKDAAPIVMGQLSRRFAIAAVITLLLNIAVAAILTRGNPQPTPIVMEVYSATVLGLLIFHAMGGLMVEQGNYLQRTNQYNTNQMFAAVLGVSVLFIVLMMYFLAFDLATARPPRIYERDMIFGTLAVLGLGWFVYRLAHH